MDEENIKNYFLGKLAEAEAESLEETLAESIELSEKAEMIELELVDSYIRRELPVAESRLFEQNYLITEARHAKLKSAKVFQAVLKQEKSVEGVSTVWQKLVAFWNAPRLAFAGLTLLSLTIIGFFFLLPKAENRREIVATDNQNLTLPTFTPRGTVEASPKIAASPNLPVNQTAPNSNSKTGEINPAKTANANKKLNLSPTPKPEIKPTSNIATPEKNAPMIATFTLLPGTLRSEEGEQFIEILPKTEKIALRLKLPPEAGKFQTYRATLKTADGETVFDAANLKTPKPIFPAAKLENRTYILFLEGQTGKSKPAESITEYTFRVKRQ